MSIYQDTKSSLTKHKKCLMGPRLIELVKHLSWSFLQQKLSAYSQKQCSLKSSTLYV